MPTEAPAVDLRYPIGKLERKSALSPDDRRIAIEHIAQTPGLLSAAVAALTPEQLDTPYRDGGWTVRQLVHHIADSHMNAFVRFKLALTEQEPTIKPYDQAAWAELADSKAPVEVSLALLAALHQRWVPLLRGMKPEDFARTVRHPEMGIVTLDGSLGIYSWHGRHHVAHVTSLRARKGWNQVAARHAMLRAFGTYWTLARGYRLRPWASPYIRWRLETLLGGDMHALGAKQFFSIVWRERRRLSRFLDWAEEHRG